MAKIKVSEVNKFLSLCKVENPNSEMWKLIQEHGGSNYLKLRIVEEMKSLLIMGPGLTKNQSDTNYKRVIQLTLFARYLDTRS